MPSETFSLDLISGTFLSLTGTHFSLEGNANYFYGTLSPAPYSGAGRVRIFSTAAGGGLNLMDAPSTNWAGAPGTANRWVEWFCQIGTLPSHVALMGGTYYYAQSGIAVSPTGVLSGYDSGTNTHYNSSASGFVPTGQWFRMAMHHSSGTMGELRFFKGANLLGTVPDWSLDGGTLTHHGYGFIGRSSATLTSSHALSVDQVTMSSDGFPGDVVPPTSKRGWGIVR
jgi:hypothetical protein